VTEYLAKFYGSLAEGKSAGSEKLRHEFSQEQISRLVEDSNAGVFAWTRNENDQTAQYTANSALYNADGDAVVMPVFLKYDAPIGRLDFDGGGSGAFVFPASWYLGFGKEEEFGLGTREYTALPITGERSTQIFLANENWNYESLFFGGLELFVDRKTEREKLELIVSAIETVAEQTRLGNIYWTREQTPNDPKKTRHTAAVTLDNAKGRRIRIPAFVEVTETREGHSSKIGLGLREDNGLSQAMLSKKVHDFAVNYFRPSEEWLQASRY
jgi:hypothetical protein